MKLLIAINGNPAAGTGTARDNGRDKFFVAQQNFHRAIETEVINKAIVVLQQRYSGWPGASQPPKISF